MIRASSFYWLYAVLILSGCSPTFLIQSAYQQGKILLAREPISEVVARPEVDSELKQKLKLVLQAREFAIEIGLNPKGSFTLYSEVDKDVLLWVVAGSKPDSFSLHTWWFPIVGYVPYKGFHDRADAMAEGQILKEQGFEVFIRGADTFSTLGWFDDPVITPTLKRDNLNIINTVIHESVHSTVWIPNNVPFNESLANFVGARGALEFYKKHLPNKVAEASSAYKNELLLGDSINKLFNELNEIYQSYAPREVKLEYRQKIFDHWIGPIKQKNPGMRAFAEINNAEIMQFKFYLTELKEFERIFTSCGEEWGCFIDKIERIRKNAEHGANPFEILKSLS